MRLFAPQWDAFAEGAIVSGSIISKHRKYSRRNYFSSLLFPILIFVPVIWFGRCSNKTTRNCSDSSTHIHPSHSHHHITLLPQKNQQCKLRLVAKHTLPLPNTALCIVILLGEKHMLPPEQISLFYIFQCNFAATHHQNATF